MFTFRQVTGLAETYSSAREALEAESDVAAGDANTEVSPRKNAAATNAHTLEGHRQTMAGVVPRLYQLLSNAVEADDARARSHSQESYGGGNGSPGAGVTVSTEGIRAVLHGKSWLWVGDAFVPADQVRQNSDGFVRFALTLTPPLRPSFSDQESASQPGC